jgi:hypothetical protein
MPRRSAVKSYRRRRGPRGFVDSPATHTVALSALANWDVPFTSAAVSIPWGSYNGMARLSDFYEYFKPISYRISIQQTITGGGTLEAYSNVSAFYPINYPVQTTPTDITINEGGLMGMRGNVIFQKGANNRGAFVSWPQHNQNLSLKDGITKSSGIFVTSSQNPTTAGGKTWFTIQVTCKFFRRNPFPGEIGVPVVPIVELQSPAILHQVQLDELPFQ